MPEINSLYCIWIFLIPAVTSLLILLFGRFKVFREVLALAGMTATFILSVIIFYKTQSRVLTAFNNNLRMDSFSGLVCALLGLVGLIVLIFSFRYIGHDRESGLIPEKKVKSYYWQIMLFIGTMLLATTANNIILLWIVIEATTLAATILVAFYWNKNALEAGFKFVLLLTVGMSFALIGCILLYSGAASYAVQGQDPLLLTNITAIAKSGAIPKGTILLAAAFILAGFGTKAGIVPFHAWLPDAHAEAPSPVSSLLSGVMIKVGIYALIRTFAMFFSAASIISVFIIVLGIFTIITGVFMMLAQEDIKRFLAYSSVSQIGYIILGFGLAGVAASTGTADNGAYLGLYGALFHMINHGLIKTLLFLCAGAVIYATGARNIRELGGLGKKMPVTGFCFFTAGLSISGVPFLNGFVSKFNIYLAGAKIEGMLWTTIVAILCSVITLAGIVYISYKIFLGPMPESLEKKEIKEVPMSLWSMLFILSLFCILLGVYPQIIHPYLDKAVNLVLSIIY